MNVLGEAFRAALASLNAHRLRSFLTTLGILIGTMAVIAVVSVLQGFSDSISDQFAESLQCPRSYQWLHRVGPMFVIE